MQKTLTNTSILKPLKDVFNAFLKRNISCFCNQNTLRDACEFALFSGGKRCRPLIVMMIAQALGNKLDVLEACLSVEFFHTASLIVDDLPCMDNEDFRRSKPALHRVFGEAVALLASHALISAGYERIFRSVKVLSKEREPFKNRAEKVCMIAFDIATHGAGISGAVGGQYKDLFSKERSLTEILDVIYKKTITFFEIAFVFGWIFGGGDLSCVDKMRNLAYHFGMAFQIVDDLCDMEQDGTASLNMGCVFGKEIAYVRFKEEIEKFTRKLIKIDLMIPEFQQMIDMLSYHAKTSS